MKPVSLRRFANGLVFAALVLTIAACGQEEVKVGAVGTAPGAPPGTPTPPGGPPPAAGTYLVSWDAVSDPGVNGYRVYYSKTSFASGGTPGHVDVGLSSTSVLLSPASYGIAAGQTLYVAVTSLGSNGGESPLSSQASIVVQ